MKIIYMGSPSCAIAPLKALIEAHRQDELKLVAVVSQPARIQGRGRKKHPQDPPVAAFAKELGIHVLQPFSARDQDFLEELNLLEPDIIVTAAYGQILSSDFLAIPARATINIHPSRLPLYRGATPVQAAILAGDQETAVSLLFTVKALDAGAIILQKDYKIGAGECAGDLTDRLFSESAPLLLEGIRLLADPRFKGIEQDEAAVTFCGKIHKDDGAVDWLQTSAQIEQKFRAFHPWPGTSSVLANKEVQLLNMKILSPADMAGQRNAEPGTVRYLKAANMLAVRCDDGWIGISRLKPSGSRECDAKSFWNGYGSKYCQSTI